MRDVRTAFLRQERRRWRIAVGWVVGFDGSRREREKSNFHNMQMKNINMLVINWVIFDNWRAYSIIEMGKEESEYGTNI